MSKKNDYQEKLKHPKWQKKRLEIFKRDKWTCKKCGDTDTCLNVHHKEYINGNDPWEYNNNQLITLCEHCHAVVEKYKDKCSIDDIDIYKNNKWETGARVVCVSMPDKFVFFTCDKDGENYNGYNFPYWTVKDLRDVFNKHLKK